MSETNDEIEEDPPKKSKKPLLLGVLLALLGGGGGFYASYSNMILASPPADGHAPSEIEVSALPDVSFVPVQPLTVTLNTDPTPRHLLFSSQLEVPTMYQADVEKILPRVVDVLNTYLRALKVEDIEDSAALVRIRSQMLRRVNIVAGEGRVNDLLIMEFVIN